MTCHFITDCRRFQFNDHCKFHDSFETQTLQSCIAFRSLRRFNVFKTSNLNVFLYMYASALLIDDLPLEYTLGLIVRTLYKCFY